MGSEKKKKEPSAIRKVVGLLPPRDRRNLGIVFGVSLLAAIIDVLGVSSIMPFLAVASNPNVIENNVWLKAAYDGLGFSSSQSFLIVLGIGVIGFILATSTFKAVTRYVVVRFTSQARHRLSMKLMEGYLRQEYPFFLNRNSHEFVKNVNSEIQLMVQTTLMTFVEMVGYALQLSLFIVFLFTVNPMTTLTIAFLVALVYGVIYTLLRKTVKQLGLNRFELNRERARVVSETFWGIKDTKILGVEKAFLDQYGTPSARLAQNESRAEVVGDVPKFALEAVAFSTILLFVIVIIVQTGSFQDAAVTVGLFAFAGYRMIPSMQNLFKALTKMRYGAPAAEKISHEFETVAQGSSGWKKPADRLSFQTELRLEDVSFTYPQTDRVVLDHLTLSVPYRHTIGFAGPTGSGKTTLIDIVLGLLEPQEGHLAVDGVVLGAQNRRSWQACIGYVPQTIFLSNSSVAQNIAFGVPKDQIDMGRVEKAAQLAQIHDFILSGLKQGYQTDVGERGVRLSGGQRQRLGIARALYRDPEVLVFDEATSALDNETEQAVMEAVHSLSGKVTMLMIAHRLTTLRGCDRIYLLDQGRVKDHGTYDELTLRQKSFQGSV